MRFCTSSFGSWGLAALEWPLCKLIWQEKRSFISWSSLISVPQRAEQKMDAWSLVRSLCYLFLTFSGCKRLRPEHHKLITHSSTHFFGSPRVLVDLCLGLDRQKIASEKKEKKATIKGYRINQCDMSCACLCSASNGAVTSAGWYFLNSILWTLARSTGQGGIKGFLVLRTTRTSWFVTCRGTCGPARRTGNGGT